VEYVSCTASTGPSPCCWTDWLCSTDL
jgi:hypothetical protein